MATGRFRSVPARGGEVMSFQHPFRPYTKAYIVTLGHNHNGVYGIFKDSTALYIGTGDIRERMVAHVNGDNPCITRNVPTHWTAELLSGDPKPREDVLIREYVPICNQTVPEAPDTSSSHIIQPVPSSRPKCNRN